MARSDEMLTEPARSTPTPPAQRHVSILERVTVRALAAGSSAGTTIWSEIAKDRLYRRMFPDDVCKGCQSHADAELRT